MKKSENSGHAMAWVSFGLSLASFVLAFFLNIPILLIVLGIVCEILAIADIIRSGKSIPSIIAIVLTALLLILSGLAWYNNARMLNEYNKEIQKMESEYQDLLNANIWDIEP